MLNIIAAEYPAVEDTKNNSVRLGIALKHLGYQHDAGRENRTYYAVPLRAT